MGERVTITESPDETFAFGEYLGGGLLGGEVVLLYGGLGAGKTLLTKGILNALDFDVDDVTSPSFTLVNLYKTASFDVYHIDLWRLNGVNDPATVVGLDEILENGKAVTIVEWADRLKASKFPERSISVEIVGDGDEPRNIRVQYL
ncbi:MAG: tRNA (adenosine(37)-N6)-threonylcarbamoyltransferase complex ATPase subunit type 1 TsaE [Pyrinomonadaceae bacterium]